MLTTTSEVIEMPKVGAGALILNEKNEILLMKRKKDPEAGYWSIPGGRVDFLEQIEKTIKREIREELGVDSEIVSLLGITDHIIPEKKTHWVSPCYLMRITKGVPRNVEPDKHVQIKWFPLDGLPENLAIPAKNAVRIYLKK